MPGTSPSHLSQDKYGYDMVVAVSEQAVDKSVRFMQLLAPSKEVTLCYCYDNNGTPVAADYDTVLNQAGVDPYSIPSGTYHHTDPVGKLDDAGFCFALKIKTGFCEALNNMSFKVIQFNQGKDRLMYGVACPEIHILNLSESQGGNVLKWMNLSQGPNDPPWTFTFVVNIAMRSNDEAFNSLPAEVQEAVKNLNPGSAFSLQQLYLDLNNVSLECPPVIGLDGNSEAALLLQKTFVNAYFEGLPPGSEILGYGIKPANYQPGSSAPPTVIPTDLTLEISPYVDANGDAVPQQEQLYTLNYLVMTGNKPLPGANPFNWNWVEGEEQGVMAINRNTFAAFLNQKLSKWLPQICIQPQVLLTLDGLEPIYNYHSVTDPGPHSYSMNPNDKTILSFSFNSHSGDASGINGCLGTLDVSYSVNSNVVCAGPQLIITTNAVAFMSISKSSAMAAGNALNYTAVLTYNMAIDSNGQVILSPATPVVVDHSDGISPQGPWGSIVNAFSGGYFQALIDCIKNSLHTDAFAIANFDQDITQSLRGNNFWIFPGQYDYNFTDVYFSDAQDLVTPISYKFPIPGQ